MRIMRTSCLQTHSMTIPFFGSGCSAPSPAFMLVCRCYFAPESRLAECRNALRREHKLGMEQRSSHPGGNRDQLPLPKEDLHLFRPREIREVDGAPTANL